MKPFPSCCKSPQPSKPRIPRSRSPRLETSERDVRQRRARLRHGFWHRALIGTPGHDPDRRADGHSGIHVARASQRRKVDARSDLFALGIIFYEMLTGISPFKADTAMAMMFKRTQERALLLSRSSIWACLEPSATSFRNVWRSRPKSAISPRAKLSTIWKRERRSGSQYHRADFAPHSVRAVVSKMARGWRSRRGARRRRL